MIYHAIIKDGGLFIPNIQPTAESDRCINSETVAIEVHFLQTDNVSELSKKQPQKAPRQAGRLAQTGRTLDPAFFEPLTSEELAQW